MRLLPVLLLTLAVSSCARHNVRTTPPDATAELRQAEVQVASSEAPANVATKPESLQSFMTRFRQLAAEARPARMQPRTLEETDPLLKAAIAEVFTAPSPASYRHVARQYARLGVFDRAHSYLTQAQAIAPRDPDTFDALARLWRDAGLPHIALTEAYRAVYYAPESAAFRNTLGTVLQSLGKKAEARTEFARAVTLDPRASYALNNLCYASVLLGRADQAIDACERALAIEPTMVAARNNLGLAHTVKGNVAAAREAFSAGARGDNATTLYNTGLAHSARGEYAEAVRAFAAAHAARPSMTVALQRARQAAAQLVAVSEE